MPENGCETNEHCGIQPNKREIYRTNQLKIWFDTQAKFLNLR